MIREITETVTVQKKRKATVSDFSGVELPEMHWQTASNIQCFVRDGAGNEHKVFALDLMPEELHDFRREIDLLRGRLAAKYAARVSRKPN